ncbi:hypothetical protein Bca52824_026019 [Brassica carinata]|uniref:F-box associated beta-propeller type 1 domain-containing protein n=1 Tax=Brassica carinata TaxID=52824 RepID=A0A8X7V9R8_BRACI|nr:hypothetical protein Bca52824_026019 [Brassica carinata]
MEHEGRFEGVHNQKNGLVELSTKLIGQQNRIKIEIRITTKIEANEMTWRNFLKVDMKPFTGMIWKFLRFWIGSFFVDEKKKVALIWDNYCYRAYVTGKENFLKQVALGYNYFKEVAPGGSTCLPRVFSYVPSSVQIRIGPEHAGDNRNVLYQIRQNNYKMLRLLDHGRLVFERKYFVAQERQVEMRYFLICFDFTSERFRHCLDLQSNSRNEDFVILSAVGEKQIAVLYQNTYEMEIRITTNIETNEVTWRNFLEVDVDPFRFIGMVLRFLRYGSFYVDEKNKVALISDNYFSRAYVIGEELLQGRLCDSISVREQQLAVLFYSADTDEMEIRITTKIEESNKVTWINFLKVDEEPFIGMLWKFFGVGMEVSSSTRRRKWH